MLKCPVPHSRVGKAPAFQVLHCFKVLLSAFGGLLLSRAARWQSHSAGCRSCPNHWAVSLKSRLLWAYGTCRSIKPVLACVVLRFGGSGCNIRNHSFNLVFISSRPPYMNNRVCPVSGQPCLWQCPPAPTCKWWLHGSGTASRWKRYGRKAGQYNTPTCRAALFSARKLCIGQYHIVVSAISGGAGCPVSPSLFSISFSNSISISGGRMSDKCPPLSGAVKVPCFPALQPVFSRLLLPVPVPGWPAVSRLCFPG